MTVQVTMVHAVHDLVGGTAARVVGRLATLKVLDGGETLDIKALDKSIVLGAIDLGELEK